MTNRELIQAGKGIVGFELGSTRIKATLIDPAGAPLASGAYGWENKLVEGIWSYDLEEVWSGSAACFADLAANVEKEYAIPLERVAALGVSGMMHGYLPLDESGNLLVPFRTWRNNITGDASRELSELFDFPIPQRWSIAHLYQALLKGEEHLPRVSSIMTLAGYVHWKLTGERVTGIDEASGMFPVDPATGNYYESMLDAFDREAGKRNVSWSIRDLLPRIVAAGEIAGTLTEEGARLLDPAGHLQAGIPLCPPEGDAGTGMIATNSIRPRTGNVSAGTSVFAMIVLEKALAHNHPEIDIVVTPGGKAVAMVHSNNCTSDSDAWLGLLGEAAKALGSAVSVDTLYGTLLPLALKGDPDAGGLLAYGYISGEHITGFSEGRPLFVRSPESNFNLANFVRAHLFSSLCALRAGLNILFEKEGVKVDEIRGHGGFFKTPGVGQRIMAAATNAPVSVLKTAGEGGPWGMALLAAYMVRADRALDLPDFLDRIFGSDTGEAVTPDEADAAGFDAYFRRHTAALPVERAAVESIPVK
ncbi:MAG: ATPase [Spirochaetaceae bacterium]|nr:MAG: ATPase [Spirochaetaceae bacterium]